MRLPEPTEAAPLPFHALQHAAVQPGFEHIVDAQARGRAAVHFVNTGPFRVAFEARIPDASLTGIVEWAD